jgi:NADPH-dependent curcumin reductase CurA
MPVNRKVVLRHIVAGRPEASDFALVESALQEPAEGEVLIAHECLSLDPYMGSAIKGRHMSGEIVPGDVMPGETVGRVIASRHPGYGEGQLVISRGGWQSHSLATAPEPSETGMTAALSPAARRLDAADGVPLSAYLGVLGMPGLTAYAGVVDMLAPKPGETFLVSAASGAVGSAAGQIARNMGARVVGIAGSDEKCAHVVGVFGFDACVNYRSLDWKAHLAEACPGGIDAYFDTVGGDMLKAAMGRLAMHARILLCGMMDQYNSAEILPGPSLAPVLARRAQINGLVVYDHWHKMARWRALAGRWLSEGRLAYKEHRVAGLDGAPLAFAEMMAGHNFGKTIVLLGP